MEMFENRNFRIINVDFDSFVFERFALADCEKKARMRAIDIAENTDPPHGFVPTSSLQTLHSMSSSNLQLLPSSVANTAMVYPNNPTLRMVLQPTGDLIRIHSLVNIQKFEFLFQLIH